MEQKHEVAAFAAAWQSRMPASSPEVSDDDPMMETSSDDDPTMEIGSDNDSASEPAPVHAGLTMEQAHAHFNAAMAEEQPAPAPMSAFRQAQEEQRYNLFLLEQHRLWYGMILELVRVTVRFPSLARTQGFLPPLQAT